MKADFELKNDHKYWQMISDMVDQCIDIALNLSQSGHPGGSRSKVPVMIATLLSGVMRYDIRNPEKRFGDKFILAAGHTNPMIYAILAVFNEALRRKYKETGDKKYLNPKGDEFTLVWEDLLTLRKRGGLPGHAEMEGKTLFLKCNTGASGHGLPVSVGEALALKYAGLDDVKVFAIEGEGGLTTGVTHESKNSAFGLGVGNLVWIVDWNNFGIDNRPFSDTMNGTPDDWFKPYGWNVENAEDGENFEQISDAYARLLSDKNDKNIPKLLWVKTRKGRGYYKYDNASHGAAHKRNSEDFWHTKKDFAKKYGVEFEHMDKGDDGYDKAKRQMADSLETVMSLFEKEEGLLDYLAETLINLGESVPEEKEGLTPFDKNPLDDEKLFDYENYPEGLFRQAGEKVPNSQGLYDFGSYINTYCQEKYGRPLVLACSADLAGSTKIAGFMKGYGDAEDFGMYHKEDNLKGTLFPQGITEFANAGITTGLSAINLSRNPYDEYNGFIGASSTYASFSYLKYGAYRIFSQMAQDSQIKLGKVLYVAGHSGPETAEDSRTHFGIFSPGVNQLFPKGHVINIHPWEYNEVPVMLAAALKTDIPIVVLNLTRPGILVPDRKALGMASHFEAAKGAYIIKDYDNSKPKEGVVMVRGAAVIEDLMKILPELRSDGPNVKIVAILSHELFKLQSSEYQKSIIADDEWFDSMIISSSAKRLMSEWVSNPTVLEYSLTPDFDNRWRTGGNLEEVMDEAHLSSKHQIEAIERFAKDRPKRIAFLKDSVPE